MLGFSEGVGGVRAFLTGEGNVGLGDGSDSAAWVVRRDVCLLWQWVT